MFNVFMYKGTRCNKMTKAEGIRKSIKATWQCWTMTWQQRIELACRDVDYAQELTKRNT